MGKSALAEKSKADELLEGLDDNQREAVCSLSGPVRILAGAGAGKTRTITRRIAYAVKTGNWDPQKTLAVTFSVKAAGEMRKRLSALGLEDKTQINVATFHSAALRQLRMVWRDVAESPFPHVVEDAHRLAFSAAKTVTCKDDYSHMEVRDILAEINRTKVSLINPDSYAYVCERTKRVPPAGLEPDTMSQIIKNYEMSKTALNQIDFDDILLIVCHIIREFPQCAEKICKNIAYLSVDEYQDVSPLQHRLMRMWLGLKEEKAKPKKSDMPSVCVVGDPGQTIYSFAGATSWYLLDFVNEFAPISADLRLDRDYRSTPQVINYANKILKSSPLSEDYLSLVTVRENGKRISRTVYKNDFEEAASVSAKIKNLLRSGVSADDIAVLMRINAQARPVAAEFRKAQIPFQIRKNPAFDSAGYMFDADDFKLFGSGDSKENNDVNSAAARSSDTKFSSGRVTISSIHAAKGLEWKHVFLIGCSEGLIPYGFIRDAQTLEEERRLLYVGVTRAEDVLNLSYAQAKNIDGAANRRPSRFLT